MLRYWQLLPEMHKSKLHNKFKYIEINASHFYIRKLYKHIYEHSKISCFLLNVYSICPIESANDLNLTQQIS